MIWKWWKTRNDCEIACDYVKRANVVLHVGLCKEIFARKHTAPTSRHLLSPFTATSVTSNKIASRHGAPRPPMTDLGTETAFRLDQRKHFRNSRYLLTGGQRSVDAIFTCVDLHDMSRSINMLCVTDFVPKWIIFVSEFKPASIWTCWMLIDRQICSQRSCRSFTGGFRSWLPATCMLVH